MCRVKICLYFFSLANLKAYVQIHSLIFQSDQLLSLQTHPLCEAAYEFIQSQ
jgi:hypothetical protein